MKKEIFVVVCMVFAAGAIICSDAFAQRGINASQDAAKAAKASLANRPGDSSSQIDWLDQVVNVINMNEPNSKDSSTVKNGSGNKN